MAITMKLIAGNDQLARAGGQNVIKMVNDTDPRTVSLAGVDVIELNFGKFADGRAFSQAFLLRRRLGFAGDIRATGDVLVDQLVQMQRTGFSSAVLRADQDVSFAQSQFGRHAQFYQGDAVETAPLFARA